MCFVYFVEPHRWFFPSFNGRQKDKERKGRLSLFLTKSGSHENVSPNKKTAPPASR